jgi:hypothetical protein
MSGTEADEYLSDGMSEEIITALSKVSGLRVAARTSSFFFKGKNEDIKVIGEQLRVGTVLEGSVRKAGPKLRVTAQLINVGDGYHLWSEASNELFRCVRDHHCTKGPVKNPAGAEGPRGLLVWPRVLGALEMLGGRMRGGGLETEAAVEMIEEFHGQCCTVWHRVA